MPREDVLGRAPSLPRHQVTRFRVIEQPAIVLPEVGHASRGAHHLLTACRRAAGNDERGRAASTAMFRIIR